LALATGGVYGVVSYVVEQRTRELGLRLALGATPCVIGWMMVRQVLVVALTGASCDLVMAVAFMNSLSALLFGVSRFDLETIFAVALVLIVAAVVASASAIARAARTLIL
jgi:ABC-type antimicrobial peptide transport system permease subunit